MKKLLSICGAIVCALLLSACDTIANEQETEVPLIDVLTGASVSIENDNVPIVMGPVVEGADAITSTFFIRNNGEADLVVNTIRLSDTGNFSLITAPTLPAITPPGEKLTFKVGFTPLTEGSYPLQISIESNDEAHLPFLVNYLANVTDVPIVPALEVRINSDLYTHNGSAFSFDQLETGGSANTTALLRNSGDGDLVINALSLSNSDDFGFTGLPALPLTLGEGESTGFGLVFTPRTAGNFSCAFLVTNNSGTSPYQVNLAGQCQEVIQNYTVDLLFEGITGLSWKYVYVAWIEDTDGKNIQNIYVCNRAMPPDTTGLLGHGLPVWSRPDDGAFYEHSDVDGVSGASTQGRLDVSRQLVNPEVRQFRVRFELDRSKNDNAYFGDRPAFLYESELIDLDDLKPSYGFTLIGWMVNDTLSGGYSQAPLDIDAFPFFDTVEDAVYNFRTELEYIEPVDDMISDLASDLLVTVSAE